MTSYWELVAEAGADCESAAHSGGQLNCKYLASVFSSTGERGSPTAMKDYEHEAALSACWACRPAGKHSEIKQCFPPRGKAGAERIWAWPPHLKSGINCKQLKLRRQKAQWEAMSERTLIIKIYPAGHADCSLQRLSTSTLRSFNIKTFIWTWLLQTLRQMQFQFIGQNILKQSSHFPLGLPLTFPIYIIFTCQYGDHTAHPLEGRGDLHTGSRGECWDCAYQCGENEKHTCIDVMCVHTQSCTLVLNGFINA